LLFVAILLPWILTMERAVPGFLRYALVTETAARVATPALGRNEPFWYFLVILPAAALPWTIVAATGWAARWWSTRPPVRRERVAEWGGTARPTVFLALWIAVPLVFFTVSQSKRPQYVLPLIPAVALSVEALWRGAGGGLPGARAGALGLAVLGGFLLAARDTLSEWIPAAGERVASLIPAAALAIGTVALGAGAAAWLGARHRGVVVGALSLPVLAIPVAGGPLLRAIAEDRTARPLAEAIASQAGDAQVIAIEALPLSLPYYLGRTVVLATDDGVPLTSNYLVRHWAQWGATPSAPVREREWWREALASCTRPRAFVVRADDADVRTELAANLPLLALTRKHVVYGPCGAADGERMLARSADRRTGGPAVRGSSTFPVQRSVGPPVRREWVAGAAGSAGPPGTGGVAGWDRP
jgi:4-amino-4-deoxy-L-arabinose transferase-like glycosyltransferase